MTENNSAMGTALKNSATLLCVDDEPNILSSLRRLFHGHGFRIITATSGKAALAVLETEAVDLLISDARMPEMDGTQLLSEVRNRWPSVMRLMLTGQADIAAIIEAINRGEIYRYITKPWDDEDILLTVRQALERHALEQEKHRLEVLTQQQNEALKSFNLNLEIKVAARTAELKVANDALQSANGQLKANFLTSIKVFSTLMEMRGGNLAGHSRRVANLARRTAQRLELNAGEIQNIYLAGLLHEVGKIGFSDELLNTPVAAMTPDQYDVYITHAAQAEQLLLPLADLQGAANIVLSQFERFDGAGRPQRLMKDFIPIGARILTVISDFDNLQLGTLTKVKLNAREAKTRISQGSGSRYDPAVVAAFTDVLISEARRTANKNEGTEIEISVLQLKVGMVLARDLTSPRGMLLLSKGHILDRHVIDKIIHFDKTGSSELSAYILTKAGT